MDERNLPNVIELEQGTDAWREWRMHGIGGSDLPVIMGLSPYSTPKMLWAEKKSGVSDFKGNWATNRGQRLEPEARKLASAELGIDFVPVLFQSASEPWKRVSLDGFSVHADVLFTDRVGLEIKCLGLEAHMKAAQDRIIPEHYWPQGAWQKHVSMLNRVFFAFYNPEAPKGSHLVILEAEITPEYEATVVEASTSFWHTLSGDINPYDAGDDLPYEWKGAALAYRRAKAEHEQCGKALELAETRLKELAAGRSMEGHGVKVTTSARKGTLDYAAFFKAHDELAGEVETFRKPETTTTRITITGE